MSIPALGLSEFVTRTDDLMKADLLYWRDLWFGWVTLSTATVVVGLLAELPELIQEIWPKYEIRGNTARLRELHADWIKPLAFVGWILIVLGVAGEGFFGVVVSGAESMLQDFTARQLIEARAKTEAVRVLASLNELEAARLNNRAAQLTKDAEDERLKRVQLEKRVNWRHISPAQAKSLCRALAPQFTHRVRIRSLPEQLDWESANLGTELTTALTKCGILRPSNGRDFFSVFPEPPTFGILLIAGTPEQSELPKLRHILEKNGLRVATRVETFPANPGGDIVIGICQRP